MAIEILKFGSLASLVPLRGTCANCRCEVECRLGDCKSSPDQRDNGSPHVDCPTDGCGGTIWVVDRKKKAKAKAKATP